MMGDSPKSFPVVSLPRAQELLTAPGRFFEIAQTAIHGIPTRVWKRAPATLRDLFMRARGFGGRECLVCGEDRASFEAFSRAALAVAAELASRGVRPGDRVALAMRNLPEWPAIFFGATLSGAIVVPLNAWWSADELEFALIDCGARFAFVDAERLAICADRFARCPALEHVYVCRSSGAPSSAAISRLEDVVGTVQNWGALPPGDMPAVALAADGDAAIFYTSGTLGKSRGVLCSHRNLLSSILAMGFSLARDIVRAGGEVPSEHFLDTPQRGVLLAIPLFHVTGACAVMGPSLFIGAKLVLMHKWDTEQACAIIEGEKITQVWGVPATTWQLLNSPARARHDLSSLRLVSYGGAPFGADLAAEIRRAFPRAYAGCGWGMTETAAISTSHSGEDYLRHPASCGLPAPVCDLKVMSLDGARELETGETGEVWVRGPNVAKGYWNRPAESAAVFIDGWVRTGDMARLDADGFCTIVDRAKDMLIRGGENIYCSEVENALCEHPAVAEAAVVPVVHQVLGEEPGAVVRLRNGFALSEAELRTFVAKKLAAFKVPVKIAFWPQALPRNAGGKLLRDKLKAIFAKWRQT
jgi:long-chain acyl-CoA synthetase